MVLPHGLQSQGKDSHRLRSLGENKVCRLTNPFMVSSIPQDNGMLSLLK